MCKQEYEKGVHGFTGRSKVGASAPLSLQHWPAVTVCSAEQVATAARSRSQGGPGGNSALCSR